MDVADGGHRRDERADVRQLSTLALGRRLARFAAAPPGDVDEVEEVRRQAIGVVDRHGEVDPRRPLATGVDDAHLQSAGIDPDRLGIDHPRRLAEDPGDERQRVGIDAVHHVEHIRRDHPDRRVDLGVPDRTGVRAAHGACAARRSAATLTWRPIGTTSGVADTGSLDHPALEPEHLAARGLR